VKGTNLCIYNEHNAATRGVKKLLFPARSAEIAQQTRLRSRRVCWPV